jgi:peptidoglycan/LPS O-acetylase OafA/YrhL
MLNDNSRHFESVHLLRGVAAIMVLVQHSFKSFYFWNLPWFNENILDIGQIGVSVFFVISGFVLPLSLQKNYRIHDFPRFLAKRFVRIEPTYLASLVFAIIWVWSATRLAPNATPWSLDIFQIFAHLFYLIPFTKLEWLNYIYWTLAIEFQFYLIIGLLYCILRWAADKSIMFVSVLIFLFSCSTLLHPLMPQVRLLEFAPFFGIGMLAWLCICYPVLHFIYIPLLLSLILIGFLGSLSLSNLLFGALAFFLILFWKPIQMKWRFFGTISYSLYVIHPPIVTLQHIIGNRLADTSFQAILFLFPFVTMVISIFAAWILYKLVEEPSMKISKQIKYL